MSEIILGCKMEGHKMRATREKPLKEASPGVIDTTSNVLYGYSHIVLMVPDDRICYRMENLSGQQNDLEPR